MLDFHTDRKRYFDIQVENTRDYVIPFINQSFPILAGQRVLEIGCGEAGVLKAFIEKGCIGVGVELEQGRLDYAEQWMADELAAGKVSFYSKDIYKTDVENELKGGFDIIILKDVIEHIHDQKKLISWMKTFLNPKGVIFFGFPPWQMPFGGHQQVCNSKFLNRAAYIHLLPSAIYRRILKYFKEDVDGFMEVHETGISIERFEKIVTETQYKIINKTHYLFNPIYKYKFGVKARVQNKLISKIPYFRNYLTTCVYYLITPN